MKKNNTAEKSVLNAEKITKALQEGTEKTLRNLVNEAISKFINEEEEESPEEVEDDSYDVEDVNTDDAPAVNEPDETPEEGGEEEGGEDFANDADDEWSDFEQYKVGDNDYDFTGVNGDELLKVYNKLGDDDQIFVKKQDDGTYEVKDDETGAEFVIELNPEAEAGNDEGEGEDVDLDIDLGDEEDGEDEFDIDLGSEGDEIGADDEDEPESEPESDDDEIEIDLGGDDDEDEDELNEENLGYTDSYQKDVFDKKFNMNEPADSKTTYSMDDGAPKGSEKPWAGKGDPKPFGKKVDENVDECGPNGCAPQEECNLEEEGSSQVAKRLTPKNTNRINKGVHNQRHTSQNGEYVPLKTEVDESVKKIVEKAKAIQAENKQYREAIGKIKESLKEAAVLNVNLGKLVDILVNESTTRDEKKSILARFNNVKTIKEGAELYTAIKTELNEGKKSSTPIVEKQFAASDKSLNETTIYSNGGNSALSLMDRMDNLFKKNR